jgi:hypothetical protein
MGTGKAQSVERTRKIGQQVTVVSAPSVTAAVAAFAVSIQNPAKQDPVKAEDEEKKAPGESGAFKKNSRDAV